MVPIAWGVELVGPQRRTIRAIAIRDGSSMIVSVTNVAMSGQQA